MNQANLAVIIAGSLVLGWMSASLLPAYAPSQMVLAKVIDSSTGQPIPNVTCTFNFEDSLGNLTHTQFATTNGGGIANVINSSIDFQVDVLCAGVIVDDVKLKTQGTTVVLVLA